MLALRSCGAVMGPAASLIGANTGGECSGRCRELPVRGARSPINCRMVLPAVKSMGDQGARHL